MKDILNKINTDELFSIVEIYYDDVVFLGFVHSNRIRHDDQTYDSVLRCWLIDFLVEHMNNEVEKYIKKNYAPKYTWISKCFESETSCYDVDTNNPIFENKQDCYNDMRNAALEKMKWNTQFEDDLFVGDVHYDVKFSQNEIWHKSYSGKYVYRIIEL